ncbi:response regulator [Paenibacillus harenae]|uniref:Two-component system response regulator YesN n=1 Tax=Paenibacillus harenae TaxID=306543 RepID=A0ABT9TWY1_PAEHA|nr:response regulator [Paenibacillus harenae]MDQ0058535.1 two-component system response regulator YesN [Paenibacillus harenae]MDQ0111872.1 two-component system response regulator YesN [Paenibacillus harenae]
MHKLLLVDDEQIEREGLQAILQKGFPSCEFKQARNGAQAIELAGQWLPDLVLMDIRMPGIGGLEAIERIAAFHPVAKFIMVTAYDTFDYARQAIKLGVKDYLLKPSKASEITATVGKVILEIEREKRERELREYEEDTLRKVMPLVESDVVTQLLFDHVHDVHLHDMLALLGGEVSREAFVMLVTLQLGMAPEPYYSTLKARVKHSGGGWVGAKSGRQIPIVVFRELGKSYRAQASSLVQLLLSAQQRDNGGDLFIGIGNCYGSLEEIRLSYQEALLATAGSGLPSKHRFYIDLESRGELAGGYQDPQTEKRFVESIRLGQWDAVRQTVTELIDMHDQNGASLSQSGQWVLERLWIISRVALEMGVEVEKPLFSFQVQHYRQLRAETESVMDKMIDAIIKHQNRLQPDTIGRMKQYIYENSQHDLTLEGIAKRFGLSPFYLSKMFKEQVGVNYIDYLTECRIDKAKALLLDPELSFKEITFDIGYNDPNYFSKVFKKLCGVSPTEYRRTALGIKG